MPHRGTIVHRFEIRRHHIFGAAAVMALLSAFAVALVVLQVSRAHAQVAALRSLTVQQQAQLDTMNAKASAISEQLQHVQRQNQQIQQLIGVRPKTQKLAEVRHNIDALAQETARTAAQSNLLRSLTLRVLNVRRIQALVRDRMLSAIPSIDPVAGAAVVGCFCYRSSPDNEFHPGVDLGANYGDPVRAAAAGTVATADWDGGYGLKVDIDHGNGYHTWYAHLSKAQVQAGEFVHKGQEIGLVGSTGYSTGPHLHYQVMLNGTAIDPTPFLSGVPPKVLAGLQ